MTIIIKPKEKQDRKRAKELCSKIKLILDEYKDVAVFVVQNVEWNDDGKDRQTRIKLKVHGFAIRSNFIFKPIVKGIKI